jgi:hypothetical protein
MKKYLNSKIIQSEIARHTLLVYSVFIVLIIIVAQVAIWASRNTLASTAFVESYSGLWCIGTEAQRIPSLESARVGECYVPTVNENRDNFMLIDPRSVGVAEVRVCPGNVYRADGSCPVEEEVTAVSSGRVVNCVGIAQSKCGEAKVEVFGGTADGGREVISSMVCKPAEVGRCNQDDQAASMAIYDRQNITNAADPSSVINERTFYCNPFGIIDRQDQVWVCNEHNGFGIKNGGGPALVEESLTCGGSTDPNHYKDPSFWNQLCNKDGSSSLLNITCSLYQYDWQNSDGNWYAELGLIDAVGNKYPRINQYPGSLAEQKLFAQQFLTNCRREQQYITISGRAICYDNTANPVPIPGQQITLVQKGGTIPNQTVTTDAQGQYSFTANKKIMILR